ncbi:DUF5992 family protein [Pseudoalteromonas luteoviolacea]|uniref:Uncharacterized protein n=1 Tax=Pseudoalteromonas luteoviolacea S4054 TaxID=1129367 RepID=A0A0F6A4V1_9GAMM|nr:DUF5992 family protein [Pseudoalteromonas luteoviolacea]AOT07666.1 hypothetical protein S4054249_07330 [Pseudoalteromonas luteoviolacea]AOT12582.1 hypothetical protein S40542_07330 [Pseudoalteromonas luteoviolacea]AOT17496.1 hypothetical protein S4054_07330 [Pseudoalteromonas luteoviolacea]KKE81202.1 hypothetical protein N479_23255 [Pseudoalteromonas luteoviolacea S4054]KZN66330.1 hypothetical protein N481_24350 [Pseudoalteromonas luteoviolacea S4047-1]
MSIAFSFNAVSGELVRGAKITEIANTGANKDNFYVKVTGGTGPCANGHIEFYANAAPSQSSYDQAFSIALAAAMSKASVRIYNYNNDTCHGAQFISISGL